MTPRRAGPVGPVVLLVSVALLAPARVGAASAEPDAVQRLAVRASFAAPAPPSQRPAVAPVSGPVLRRFQPPATPYGRGHRGVDLGAEPGEPVRSALPGKIVFAGPVGGRPWVTVVHDVGLDTTYGGLEPAVQVGDVVPVGGVLGHATGAGRIDWGARDRDRYVDPLGLLGGWVVRLVPVDRGS